MKLFKNRKTSKGFTLVEILIVVGFIALAGISIYTIYSKVQVSNAANTEGRNLDTLRAGVKNLYGGSSSYLNLLNKVLNNARVTPDNMRVVPYILDDVNINNSFGGSVVVSPITIGGGTSTNNAFQIVYPLVPGAVCSKLVTVSGKAYDQITIGTVIVKAFGTSSLDVTTAAAACAADAGNGVSMKFVSV